MKIGLKTKLIFSYTALLLLLLISLLFISNFLLEKQFQKYIQENQEQRNLDIVNEVLLVYKSRRMPNGEFFSNLGKIALDYGTILTVYDIFDNKLFSMNSHDRIMCNTKMNDIARTMKEYHPHIKGGYTEKIYPLVSDGKVYGTVSLGSYGPFFYNDIDIKFIEVLNNLFMNASIIFLLIAIAAGYFIASKISNPIKAVTVKAKQIEQGNYANRIDFSSSTLEIDALIKSVNTLMDTLGWQRESKNRMASDYAHEFRTPLAAIQSNLEGIIDGIFEPTNERIESIRSEILRLSRMVADIDKIGELENDSFILYKELFNFNDILNQSITTFEAELIEKDIVLNVSSSPCYVYADKDKISSVIINLISNAVKYTDKGGTIDISVLELESTLELCVTDSGVGIPKQDLPNIFEHLYRIDTSRTRKSGGSGIGLSVVKAIIKAHGGKVKVKSELGIGSTFLVVLPKN